MRPRRSRISARAWHPIGTALAGIALQSSRPRRASRTGIARLAIGAVAARRAVGAVAQFEEPLVDRREALDRLVGDLGDRRAALGRDQLAVTVPLALRLGEDLPERFAESFSQGAAELVRRRR